MDHHVRPTNGIIISISGDSNILRYKCNRTFTKNWTHTEGNIFHSPLQWLYTRNLWSGWWGLPENWPLYRKKNITQSIYIYYTKHNNHSLPSLRTGSFLLVGKFGAKRRASGACTQLPKSQLPPTRRTACQLSSFNQSARAESQNPTANKKWYTLVFACLFSRKNYLWFKSRDTKPRTITAKLRSWEGHVREWHLFRER